MDREQTADFIAMDVTTLHLQSLASPRVLRDTPRSFLRRPQWRCCFETECGSFKSLATHVLRHHRQMETVSRLVVTNQCPACREVNGDRNAAHRHLLSSIRRGFFVVFGLGQVHIPLSLCCPGVSFSSTWLNTFVTLSRMDLETPAWNKRKSEVVASQGQGRWAVRQAVAVGGSDRDVLRRLVEVLATLSLVRAEGIDRHRLQNLILSAARSPWRRQWQRQVGFITKRRAPSRTDPRQNAQRFTNSSVRRSCTCGWRSCEAWRRRRGWRQSTCRP